MGTRNLTVVIHEGKHRIAQYGQWDGSPDGQGLTALEFCRKVLVDKEKRAHFVAQLGKCAFDVDRESTKFAESIGSEDGWMNNEQAARWRQAFPYMTRDHGADILELVNDSDAERILITDSIAFAGDSLFCEWAYVIDLDKDDLEVYKGFNKRPCHAGERFADVERDKHPDGTFSEYYPVRLVVKFKISDLPDDDNFVAQACGNEDDDE